MAPILTLPNRVDKFTDFNLDDEGVLWVSGRLCIPKVDNLREEIWGKLIMQLIVYVLVLPRCTTT